MSRLTITSFIEGIIHNVILAKIVIRRFLRYFRNKYRYRKQFWQYFEIKKDFKVLTKKEHGLK
jgi:hypothetical protein